MSPEAEDRSIGGHSYRLPAHQTEVYAHDFERDFDLLRERSAVIRATFPFGGDGWVVTRYEETRAALGDPRLSLEQATKGDYPRTRASEGRGPAAASFGFMDPPEHTRHRGVLTRHFTVARVAALRPMAEEVVRGSFDEFEMSGNPADIGHFVGELVPVKVLCGLLGVPVSESDRFLSAAHPIAHGAIDVVADGERHLESLRTYFRELVDRRRVAPGDDLISAMLSDPAAQEIWSEAEFDGVGVVLLLAGHDATASMLAGIINWLAHDEETFAYLAADQRRIPAAVEEFLRLLPTGLAGPRTRIATDDMVLGGVEIRKGEAVQAVPHAANLDPRAFSEPDRFVADRRPNPHVAFGFGPHGCPGSHLARMEIDVVLRELFSRYRKLTPVALDPAWRRRMPLRGGIDVLVHWDGV